MKVLTFLHSFEPGGVERIALRLVRRWRTLGIDAPLFLGRTDGAMAEDVGQGLACIVPRSRFDTAGWETLWMILTLPRVVRRERPDVLFCAGNTYAIVALALKLLLGRSCPPIVAKVSNDLYRRDAPWLARAAYRLWLHVQGRLIDRFVGMETPMLDEISKGMRVAPDRVAIVPDPALSDALIAQLSKPVRPRSEDGRRFVSIGRLVSQKNVTLMLRAFRRGVRTQDRLTLIGDGPDRARLEALVAKLGLGDRVDFRGYVPEPASLLPDFDILLLSSDYEGVPAVILEALAANLAIVATLCSRSMSVLLDDGALGALVPVGDTVAFAAAIASAEAGQQDRARAQAQARRFTIEHAADAYLALMAETLAAQRELSIEAAAGELWRRHNPQSM